MIGINSLNEKVDKIYNTLLEPSRFEHPLVEKKSENIFKIELD